MAFWALSQIVGLALLLHIKIREGDIFRPADTVRKFATNYVIKNRNSCYNSVKTLVMSRIPVYFMPGLAASSAIFERIRLPEDIFETILLEWTLPLEGETLRQYANRMAAQVTLENPVLIGVSFGGVLVQEMAQFLKPKKVIIISSVKSNLEFPRRMRFAKTTKAYKLIPTRLMGNIELLAKLPFRGEKVQQRIKLYEKFLSMRERKYLDWALEQIIMWDRVEADANVIHIHGDADEVFPPKYIKGDFLAVPSGTHIMIISKFKWLNEHLPDLILGK